LLEASAADPSLRTGWAVVIIEGDLVSQALVIIGGDRGGGLPMTESTLAGARADRTRTETPVDGGGSVIDGTLNLRPMVTGRPTGLRGSEVLDAPEPSSSSSSLEGVDGTQYVRPMRLGCMVGRSRLADGNGVVEGALIVPPRYAGCATGLLEPTEAVDVAEGTL
jgi:hypothetical protein